MPKIGTLTSFKGETLFFNADAVAMVKAAEAPLGIDQHGAYSMVYVAGSSESGWLVKGSAGEVMHQLGWTP